MKAAAAIVVAAALLLLSGCVVFERRDGFTREYTVFP